MRQVFLSVTCRDLIKHTTKIYITNAHSNDSNAAIFVLKTLQLSIFDKTLFNSKRIFSLKRKFYQKKILESYHSIA